MAKDLMTQADLDRWNLKARLMKEKANLETSRFEYEALKFEHQKALKGKLNSIAKFEENVKKIENDLQELEG